MLKLTIDFKATGRKLALCVDNAGALSDFNKLSRFRLGWYGLTDLLQHGSLALSVRHGKNFTDMAFTLDSLDADQSQPNITVFIWFHDGTGREVTVHLFDEADIQTYMSIFRFGGITQAQIRQAQREGVVECRIRNGYVRNSASRAYLSIRRIAEGVKAA